MAHNPDVIVGESNGHTWIKWHKMICCRDCGFIRRADDKNKPCRGKVGITLRDEQSREPANG
jgi:hypothetical protein